MSEPVRSAGLALLGAWMAAAALAPLLAPNDATRAFRDHQLAPPTRMRVVHEGQLRAPFFYAHRLVHALERRYVEDRGRPVPIAFFRGGRLVASSEPGQPLLLAGADASGRDIFSRLLAGARISLGIALAAALGATLAGLVAGAVAGYAGGPADTGLMRLAEVAAVLPALYVLLALRAALPLVLAPGTTAAVTIGIFVLVGWPHVARGARNIVAAERRQEYVDAALALGASAPRVLARHLVPACRGFLGTQIVLLVPGFVMAEATLSFAGLGFTDAAPSWGTMLQQAANVSVLSTAPWVLAPAAAIFSVVLALNLVVRESRRPASGRARPHTPDVRLA